MNIYSHKDKLLIDHLQEVAKNCHRIILERTWLNNFIISRDIVGSVAFLCGAFHDLGKATLFFQHYLLTEGKENSKGPKNHALISALFVYQVVKKYLDTVDVPFFEKQILSVYAYTTTRRHHGGLCNLEDEIYLKDKSKELNEIIEAFHEEEVQLIIDHFLATFNISYSLENFKIYIKTRSFEVDLPDFYDDNIDTEKFEVHNFSEKIQLFYLHQLLYSTLLLSDKTDVIVDVNIDSNYNFPENSIEKYRRRKNFDQEKSELDIQKNRAYYTSLQNIKKIFSINQFIYSLTLPTGLGKTITSLAVALELKKLNPTIKRLIISIPFTSIIDQNFEVYHDIVGTNNSSILLKHHHQAEPAYKLNEQDLTPDVSQFLIETWQSKIVVTTFVQLLNSIFSRDKSLLMKLPSLSDSVIILDEIQTIDYIHWKLINEVFTEIGKLFNCYFILMSATQPMIFLPEVEIKEIVPDYKSYFSLFNRTRIINKALTPISLNSFVNEVTLYAVENPKKDILVIMNTKSSCLSVFKQLVESIDKDKSELYFMSTSITPYERKRIIGLLKAKNSGRQRIVVTTQLIEAGVDISVDSVFRIIAPIDAIIQAAGRGNRYNEKGYPCDVFIYEISESIRGSQLVYGNDLLLKSKNVLKNINEIEEKDYLKLIESYFLEVKIHSNRHNSEFLKNIGLLEFYSLGDFSLIEEKETESLFVQINKEAKKTWEKFISIYSNNNTTIFEKRLEFGKIKSKFYDYVVNIPIQRGEKAISFDSDKINGFYLVELETYSPFYPYSESNFLINTGYQPIQTVNI